MWEKNIKCKFCQTEFQAAELDVRYEDLRDPLFFIPDFQYFVVCTLCESKLVQTDIPSDIAVRIQERLHAESNASTDTE